eukprot:UN02420
MIVVISPFPHIHPNSSTSYNYSSPSPNSPLHFHHYSVLTFKKEQNKTAQYKTKPADSEVSRSSFSYDNMIKLICIIIALYILFVFFFSLITLCFSSLLLCEYISSVIFSTSNPLSDIYTYGYSPLSLFHLPLPYCIINCHGDITIFKMKQDAPFFLLPRSSLYIPPFLNSDPT